MINRTPITCLACNKPITARIQIGHETEQPISFACPHCGTEVRLTLLLDEPPHVKIRWEENAALGTKEGAIINIGAGFTIAKEMLHEDFYFPSFDAPRPNLDMFNIPQGHTGPFFIDTSVALGTLPQAAEQWRIVQRAMRFNRTGQQANLDAQLDLFWGSPRTNEQTLDNALFNFLLRLLEPNGKTWLAPLGKSLALANSVNAIEYQKFISHYDGDLKNERFEAYSEIFSEYFKAYGEFSQTFVYSRHEQPIPADTVATSSDFERTRMFYGNAFEVLGSHLDVPAAINNILCGRAYDQMNAMDLKQFRTINKAGRTNCFANNIDLSWLVVEYDSTIRNASHHRWFKLDDSRTQISYRSGGTGALNRMSYADYLLRCNRLVIQLMVLACLELVLLSSSNKVL